MNWKNTQTRNESKTAGIDLTLCMLTLWQKRRSPERSGLLLVLGSVDKKLPSKNEKRECRSRLGDRSTIVSVKALKTGYVQAAGGSVAGGSSAHIGKTHGRRFRRRIQQFVKEYIKSRKRSWMKGQRCGLKQYPDNRGRCPDSRYCRITRSLKTRKLV